MRFYPATLFLIFLFLSVPLWSEDHSILDKTTVIEIEPGKTNYELGYEYIILSSERVICHDIVFIKNIDYSIDYVRGFISFLKEMQSGQKIRITFKVFPKSLLYAFQEFSPQDNVLRPNKNSNKVVKKQNYDTSANLNISGSKSFALSLGNQQNMDLDQSLYLQVDGELSKNVFIKAQLSDNTTPISPEGTTKKLSEFDKMFIKVYSGNYNLQFGDFFVRFDDTHYANYDYKLEGVTFQIEGKQKVKGSVAVSNGDFKSYSFYGTEGIQGPYYLPGNNSSKVRVLSGTEKIYLNGRLLDRGEDYFIDYNEGSVTFQNMNIITEDSYIIADYEYTAEEYRSNFYLGSGDISLFNNGLNVSMKIVSNNDDKDNPLNFSFTEKEKEVLRNAGNDSDKARISGVDSVEVGQGNYILVDSHYVYVGFDSTGNYLVSFSYVGSGKGSYNKSGYIQYEYVGDGEGEYIPKIQLPFPEKRANLDIRAQMTFDKFELLSEGMFTHWDKNSFSHIDDKYNNGFAHYHSIKLNMPIIYNSSINSSVYYRAHDKYFRSLARTESASTQYQTSDFTEVDTVDVEEFGGSAKISFLKVITNTTQFYDKQMKEIAHLQTFLNSFSYQQNKTLFLLPSLQYSFSQIQEKIPSSITKSNNELIQRTHALAGNYKIGSVEVNAGFSDRKFTHEGALDFGFSNIKYKYGLNAQFWNTEVDFAYEQEFVDSLNNYWFDYKKARLYKAGIAYMNKKTNIKLDYSHRSNYYFTGESNNNFDLLNCLITFDLFRNSMSNRVNYKIGNLELYPKVKELIFVGYGNGLYDSLGFYQEDGDYDYEITIVGNPQPVTELQMNWNVNINPSRSSNETTTKLSKFLKNFTFISDVVIQEKSSTPHKIDLYLLKPSALFNKLYTDYGYQRYKEQLWYNIIRNKLAIRLLYEKTKKIDNQYENEFDELDQDDYTATVNIYNVRKWNFENEMGYTDIISNYQTADFLRSKIYGISTDIAYKFSYTMILSTLLGVDIEKGAKLDGSDEYKITSYTIAPEFVYNAGSRYHLMLKLNLQENRREGSDYFSNVLYSKRNGLSTRLTVQFDYKFSKFVTGFLKYYFEKYPQADARYQLKMEVRADF